MRLVQLSGPGSNSGKTITTIILARLLKEKGYDIRGFKCGPDYIDSKFLSLATGKTGGNLDLHLMGEKGMRGALALNRGELGIIEGAMGYFDGIGRGLDASAYDIARTLDINTILVYRPGGEMFTMIPKLKGMIDFSEGRIKGIIFAMTNKMLYMQYKALVEEYLNLEVLGHVEKIDDLCLPNVKLGLVDPVEFKEFDQKLTEAALRAEETLELDKIIGLMTEIPMVHEYEGKFSGLKLAIAKDMAFSFLYGENRKLLEKYFEIEYFSPLYDKELPKADMVFLPGGRVEDFKYNLSRNISMIESVRKYFYSGGIIYGESGGLSYMAKSIGPAPMCGILEGKVQITDRLQNFGYVNIILGEDCLLGKEGTVIPAHEFHYTYYEGREKAINEVVKASLSKEWTCGYRVGNSYFSFQHINFSGNEKIIGNMIEYIKEKKCI